MALRSLLLALVLLSVAAGNAAPGMRRYGHERGATGPVSGDAAAAASGPALQGPVLETPVYGTAEKR